MSNTNTTPAAPQPVAEVPSIPAIEHDPAKPSTQPTGTRAARREQSAAKREANKEALDGAKKVAEVLPTPAKKAPAKKASPAKATSTDKTPGTATAKPSPVKAVPAKAVAPKAAPKVQELPAPAPLEWTENKDDGGVDATDSKYTFKVREGSAGGWYAQLRTTKGGRWVNVAGKAPSMADAKLLAEYASAGAMWLTYAKHSGTPFATVIANHTPAAAKGGK